MKVDLLVHNAGQLITCAAPAGPKCGPALADVGLIPGGAVAIRDGQITAVGPSAELERTCAPSDRLDAGSRVVCPGLIDAHTHAVYAGDRVAEFELRLRGATYMEIMQAGGGIASTMRATRRATVEELAAQSRPRLDAMLALGTTAAEVKTGYGLETAAEIRMLETIAVLDRDHPLDLVPTFLGAHAVPPEYAGQAETYLGRVIDEMLPQVAAWYRASSFAARGVPLFCDAFCEQGVFDLDQTRRVLEAGRAWGLPLKLHADEFVSLGGVPLAVSLGAVSVDHLDVTPPAEFVTLAAAGTLAVLLPAVTLNLGGSHAAPARAMADAGVPLALATDLNPGSAPCPSMPLVMALACRYGWLSPAEALNAATINAAHAIGLGARLGSIEVGKQADLLIVDAPDYRHLAYWLGRNLIARVIKKGQIVNQEIRP